MARKNFEPIHPLAMAKALEEINHRCANVIMSAHTAQSLQDGANEAQLRALLKTVCDATDELRAALWSEDEG